MKLFLLIVIILPLNANKHHYRHENSKYPYLDKLLNKMSNSATTNSVPSTTDRYNVKPVTFQVEDVKEEIYEDNEDTSDEEELDADKWTTRHNKFASRPINNRVDLQMTEPEQQYQGSQPTDYSYSHFKWQVLGDRQRLEQYRRNQLQSSRVHTPLPNVQPKKTSPAVSSEIAMREAIQHALKVSQQGSCKYPKPKIIHVKQHYPHPSKTYIPHCTILHQCGDDTGCCKGETFTCGPKESHKVEMYFYTKTLGNKHGTTEKLEFYNHTECDCFEKTEELMPRDPSKPEGRSVYGSSVRFAETRFTNGRIPEEKSCRCPSDFAIRHQPDGSCTCDCFDREKICIRLKRGRDYFSVQDRWCLQATRCDQPTCEYGHYNARAGRCPRKKERFNSWNRYQMDQQTATKA